MADKGAMWHDEEAKPLLEIWQAYLVRSQCRSLSNLAAWVTRLKGSATTNSRIECPHVKVQPASVCERGFTDIANNAHVYVYIYKRTEITYKIQDAQHNTLQNISASMLYRHTMQDGSLYINNFEHPCMKMGPTILHRLKF